MKLLFDENFRASLSHDCPNCIPVQLMWRISIYLSVPIAKSGIFAQASGFIIVTADADFYELAAAMGPPPKVIWLRRWTHPTRDAELVLRRDAIRITEFAADSTIGLLVLDRQ